MLASSMIAAANSSPRGARRASGSVPHRGCQLRHGDPRPGGPPWRLRAAAAPSVLCGQAPAAQAGAQAPTRSRSLRSHGAGSSPLAITSYDMDRSS